MLKRILTTLLIIGFGITLNAQDKKEYGHLTFAIDLGLGSSLFNLPKELSRPGDSKGGANTGISLLYHIPSIRSQVGLGFSGIGHGYPDGYKVDGIHLDYKYHLSKKLRPLVLHTRLGYSFNKPSNIGDIWYGDYTHYTADKYYTTIALGWEFSRLLGPLGISPSVGVSYSSFSYKVGNAPTLTGSSSQAMLFGRLTILIN